MDIKELTKLVIDNKAQTLHITPNMPPFLNINGRLNRSCLDKLSEDTVNDLVSSLLTRTQTDCFITDSSINFTFADTDAGRFRITFYKQRGLTGAVMRPIPNEIPSLEDLHLPDAVKKVLDIRSGLVIIGGHSGSGKSSTLAAMINEINLKRKVHIITIEDPIEYLFTPNKALFSQREVGRDSKSFAQAMSSAVRQDTDVIMIGEMRDRETVRIALNAAEAGTLVIGTMPTTDCVQTITRLIGLFPSDFQNQARTQVAAVLKAVICQQLVMRHDGEARLPALEIMFSNSGIRNLIREQKFHQVYSVIESSSEEGMQTLDQSLQQLYKSKEISDVEVVTKAHKPDELQRKMYSEVKNEIPAPDGLGFSDMGEDVIPIENKIIRYKADFSPGQEGAWTSSIAVVFQDPGMILVKPPGLTSNRLYVSDFNIVSKRKPPFALPHRMLVRFKLELDENNTRPGDMSEISVKLFTLPQKDKPTAFSKINLSFPIMLDEKWHTWVINIPDEAVDKMLKISMLEFPGSLTKVSISDMIFF